MGKCWRVGGRSEQVREGADGEWGKEKLAEERVGSAGKGNSMDGGKMFTWAIWSRDPRKQSHVSVTLQLGRPPLYNLRLSLCPLVPALSRLLSAFLSDSCCITPC